VGIFGYRPVCNNCGAGRGFLDIGEKGQNLQKQSETNGGISAIEAFDDINALLNQIGLAAAGFVDFSAQNNFVERIGGYQ
jgi:hypothetical protein